MTINENWNRWIFASISTYFYSQRQGLHMRVEGDGQTLQGDYLELRWDGPTWLQQSPSRFQGVILINLLVRATRDEKDFHKIYRMIGIGTKCFADCIPIKKYGNNPSVDDSSVVVDYLKLIREGNKTIDTINYGQISPDVPSIQSTIEGKYKTVLSTLL